MAALAKLYEFLEKKRDEEHIDSMFCFHMMHFHLKKAPCTAWDSFVWEIERLVENENCLMGKWLILCIWKYETQTWFPYFHYTKYF